MRRNTRRKLFTWLVVTAVSAAAGLCYILLLSVIIDGFKLTPSRAIFEGGGYGLVIGGSGSAMHFFYQEGAAGAWIRRLSFIRSLAVRVVMTAGLIVCALTFCRLAISRMSPADPQFFAGLPRDALFSLGVFAIFYFVLQMRQIIGGRVLTNFILGRYNKPVREERVFLFLDLAGSTALAERLGDVGAYTLISRFFFDIDEVTTEFGGETHRYVGDQVVVTWPLERGVRDATCLRCTLAIGDRLAARATDYQAAFGAVPAFRVGLHGGPVVAGECGGSKQEIVYFGDTVNTAARLEQQCKALDRSLLVSGELLSHIDLPADLRAESLGRVVLRGHDHDIELFDVRRAEETAVPAVPPCGPHTRM